jgi:hypothetical protein
VSTGREMLLGMVGEEELARHLKRLARRKRGVHGLHTRYSQGVLEGIHTLRIDGHSDVHGMPDWMLWSDEGWLAFVELKTDIGRVLRDQAQRVEQLNRITRVSAHVVRPKDEDLLDRILNGRGAS